MEIKNLKIADLVPYHNNARTHSPEQIKRVADSIREFGFCNPVLVDSQNGIIAGHGRVMAAEELGMDSVPTVCLDHLSDDQKRAYILADNKLALDAGWDDDLLKLEFADLLAEGFDVELTGFSSDEIDSLLALGEEVEGLTDPDEVPEAPTDPVTVAGDLWVLGNHRLLCGDSTSIDAVERLMDGQKSDMVFTDPPYGVDYEGGSKKREKLKDDHIGTDIYSAAVPLMAMFCRGPCYTWYADTKPNGLYNAVDQCGDIHSLIIWAKNNSTFNMNIHYKQRHEPCLYWKPKGTTLLWAGNNKEDTVWEIKREPKNEFHPTQKPVELAERAIKNHSICTVLDLFGGSGSTLIACEKTKRTCYMMEFDQQYCDVIINRWQDFTGEVAVHENGKTYNELKADASA